MYVINAQDVNQAYEEGMKLLQREGIRSKSRVGEVIVMDCPVTTVYEYPNYRVLINETRDANPFFHAMECIWMLAGSKDGKWLDTYVSTFSSRYGEDDGSIHGAYGYRWRQHFVRDQLKIIGKMFFEDPLTRRALLSMWDTDADLAMGVKDMPCNTHAYFRSRGDLLDLTVCNRSNDIIWGAYGANAVHMSVMADVVAGLSGMRLGKYYQISNNYHAYTEVFEKMIDSVENQDYLLLYAVPHPITFGSDKETRRESAFAVLEDCEKFMTSGVNARYKSPWIRNVIVPIAETHKLYRAKQYLDAIESTEMIQSEDWRKACKLWLLRRMEKKNV